MRDLITYCRAAISYFAKKKNSKACFELFLYKLPIINEIVSALEIPFDATILSQKVSFTLSDFFGCWLTIIRRLDKLSKALNRTTDFARILLSNIEERRTSLLNNQAMICAVYLDKRFAFKLSADEKQIARLSLESLFNRVKNVQHRSAPDAAPDLDKEDSFEKECSAAGLPKIFDIQKSASQPDNCFSDLLDSYEALDRQHHKSDILVFWREHKFLYPEMHQLASILLSIPPSQSTVERSFSILGYMYSCRRTKLSPAILEDMMCINLNRELIDAINERDLERLN